MIVGSEEGKFAFEHQGWRVFLKWAVGKYHLSLARNVKIILTKRGTETCLQYYLGFLNPVLSKKVNPQQCKNCRTISRMCHPSKVTLKRLLNGLTPQAETIITEEQTGFREGQYNTVIPEQIFNLRILCERYLQYQQKLSITSFLI